MLESVYPVSGQQTGISKVKFNTQDRYRFIISIFLAYFIGQAEIAGYFPLVLIYLTLLVMDRPFFFLISVLAAGAGLLHSRDIFNLIYLIPALSGFIIYGSFKARGREPNIALVNALIYLVLAVLRNCYLGILPVYYLFSAIEAVSIYILAYIGLQGSKELIDKEKKLTSLALLTLFMISGGLFIGLANIIMFSAGVVNTIVYILIFSTANVLGFNYSIITAVSYGVLLVCTGVIPMIDMFSFILFSLSSSLFYGRKKYWILIGAFIGFLLYSGFAITYYNLGRTAFEVAVALLIFMLVPVRYWTRLYYCFQENEETSFFPAVSQEFRQHLSELSKIFAELSNLFKDTVLIESPARMLDDFAFIFRNKVCGKCKRKFICWQQEREDTYKRIFVLLKTANNKGYLTLELVERILEEKCPYTKQIIGAAKSSFEICQINNYWRNRLKEKHMIISEQLAGVGEIVDQFSHESSLNLRANVVMESLKKKAEKAGIDIYSIEVQKNINSNKNCFIIKMEQCSGNCSCEGQVLELLNSVYEYDYRILKKHCGNKMKDENCEVFYGPVGRYSLSIANILRPSSDTGFSGDSFLHKGLKDGKDIVVISDGMGTGKKAALESSAALSLLEKIIDAGFNQNLAVKTINSALFLRNQEETFTTLDIFLFDTFTARATFNKIGAMASYIKRNWDLIKIDSASLPAGILEKIDVSTEEIELMDGDFVVMFTDGLLDLRYDINDKEEWLRQTLQNSSFDRAEEMCDYIRELVMNFDGSIIDDLTAVIIKVEEFDKKRRKFKGLPRINIVK